MLTIPRWQNYRHSWLTDQLASTPLPFVAKHCPLSVTTCMREHRLSRDRAFSCLPTVQTTLYKWLLFHFKMGTLLLWLCGQRALVACCASQSLCRTGHSSEGPSAQAAEAATMRLHPTDSSSQWPLSQHPPCTCVFALARLCVWYVLCVCVCVTVLVYVQ